MVVVGGPVYGVVVGAVVVVFVLPLLVVDAPFFEVVLAPLFVVIMTPLLVVVAPLFVVVISVIVDGVASLPLANGSVVVGRVLVCVLDGVLGSDLLFLLNLCWTYLPSITVVMDTRATHRIHTTRI